MPKKPHINQRDTGDATGSRPPLRPRQDTRGLGRGLQALLGDGDVVRTITGHDATDSPRPDTTIALDRITPSRWQPRQDFDTTELQELAASVKHHGIIQPLLVRPHPDPAKPDHFELIAGERRWRAAGLAKLHQVPVIIRDTSDGQAAEIALIENIQRRDLNAIEEGRGYAKLIDEFGYTQEALATIIGKSRAHLANSMRLLNLPDKVQRMLAKGVVSVGQVRPLIGRPNASELAEMIVRKNMTARQVETLVAELQGRAGNGKAKTKGGRQKASDADTKEMEDALTAHLGLAVKLDFNSVSGKGSVQVRTTSLEQFEAVVKLLQQ